MVSRNDIKQDIVKKFNLEYKDDLLNLEQCYGLKSYFENQIKEINAELNLQNPNSSITQTIRTTIETLDEIGQVTLRANKAIKEVSLHLEETNGFKTQLEEYFEQLRMLECTLQYMKIVEYIEFLSDELQKEIEKKDDEKCATIFANITEIAKQLVTSPAIYLKSYLKETILHWQNILKGSYLKKFTQALNEIKWPFINANLSLETPVITNITTLQILVEYLLQIDVPEELAAAPETSPILADFRPLSLPMQLLLEPLRKRFLFHFYGARKTNRQDKPEWYFTKILSWIRDHTEFVEKWIQPVYDKMGLDYIEAKIELMRGLVQLAVEKLANDLPTLQHGDFIFAHCVDEALGFDIELKENYNYPATQPGVLVVLTQAQVFIKWMAMEKKFAVEKMDVMLSDSFEPAQTLDSDTEGLKIAPCGDIFITLLQTITERYEVLPQPGHRLQFLQLQLDLLDDFRVRLLQLVSAQQGDVMNSNIPVIANTIYYIENVLEDWGTMMHYLNLHYYKSQLENPGNKSADFDNNQSDFEVGTVFAETLSLYRHMRKDLLFTLTDSVVMTARTCSRGYRHEMWSQIKGPKDMRSLSLTPTACPIFELLATSLHQLQKFLTEKLFTIAWKSIAQQIDTFLFDDIVLESRFSEGGALQFKFDVTRNLLPLFSQYTDKPESYFTQLCEACALLNVSKGSALLLRETLLALEGATGVEDRRGQALKEVGVHLFTPSMALQILNRRTDITVNRIAID